MPSEHTRQATEPKEREPSLTLSLKAVPSKLQVSQDREIAFTRAILSMPHTGGLIQVIPHVTLGQERGSIQDVSAALLKAVSAGKIAVKVHYHRGRKHLVFCIKPFRKTEDLRPFHVLALHKKTEFLKGLPFLSAKIILPDIFDH